MAKTMARLALALLGLVAAHPVAAQSPAASLALVGVIMPEGREPMAILEDPRSHQQQLYSLGAQIGDVRLTKILRDRVVLTAGGGGDFEVRLARSSSPPPSKARASTPPSRQRRRSLLNRLLPRARSSR